MRVPCSSWARGFLRYRLGMTADHLVVRSTTGCDGWPPSANFVPETCARQQEHGRYTVYHKAKRTRRTLPWPRCQGEGRGFESRRPLKSPAERHFPSFVDTGRASPCKGEGRGLEPRRCAREAAGGGEFRAPA